MQIESIPIASLVSDPANARLHSPRNLEVIRGSLQRFGQQKPIVIDQHNVVRAGNGTLEAAKSLGWTHIDVVRTELKGAEATAYAIADNRAGELATWDDAVLSTALADAEIGDVGFTQQELDDLLGQSPPAIEEQADSLDVGDKFQVIVECEDEDDQKSLFDRLTTEGYPCRLLTL